MNYYNLDPANYLTAPGLAWDSMLLYTDIKLELVTDIEILKMVEKMKRGGLCFVGSKRHVKANNKYLKDYDDKHESSYIMYWDANNQHGWAMCTHLPYKGLKFTSAYEDTLEMVINTADDSDIGYAVECCLIYPIDIHNKLKEYPPAPEHIKPDVEWFSEFKKRIGANIGSVKYDDEKDEYTKKNRNT